MKPFVMTVPVEITEERLNDLIILCVEHGGYGTFNYHDDSKTTETDELEYHELPLTADGWVSFTDKYEEENGDTGNEVFTLNRAAVERGLKIMSEKYTKHFTDFINEADDVITGDVFLQCALFGDIIYG